MFFQEATPDTSGYMIAGYAIAFIVMGLYVASLYIRNRNLNQDMTTLQEMEESIAKVEPTKPKPKNPAKTVTKQRQKK